jgi:phosphoribosylanthranilate isomerase
MWIKICGITRPEDGEVAASAGADAIGFIFWPGSARYIAPVAAGGIAQDLPDGLSRVGVFVNEEREKIIETAAAARLTHIQLHGDETPDLAANLPLPVIRAFRSSPTQEELEPWQQVFALLADGAAPGAYGGTGTEADAAVVGAVQGHSRLILAGGLAPTNVAMRVKQVRPWGIDASSGLEDAPGLKSHQKVRIFIANARGALADD